MVISSFVQPKIMSTFPGLRTALGARDTEMPQTGKGSAAQMELSIQQRDRRKATKHKYINFFQMAGSSVTRDGKQGI